MFCSLEQQHILPFILASSLSLDETQLYFLYSVFVEGSTSIDILLDPDGKGVSFVVK